MNALNNALKIALNPNTPEGDVVAVLWAGIATDMAKLRSERVAAARIDKAAIATAYDARPAGDTLRLVRSGDGWSVEELTFYPGKKCWEYKSVYFSRNKADAEKAFARRK